MKSLYIIIPLLATLYLTSCKLGESLVKASDNITGEIDSIRAEIFPLDSAGKKIVIGLLEGVAAPSSQDNIDTLTKTLSEGISKYLNAQFKDLDTKSLGSNLIKGVKDEFNSPEFQDSLTIVISNIFSSASADISKTIDNAFNDLTSGENKKKLESLLAGFFTEANSEQMRKFINEGIQGISFTSLADSLRQNLFNEETGEALNKIIPTKIDSILDKTEGILDKLGENGESFIERNIWTIVASIASLMLLGTLLFLWRKKSQENKMNDVIMAAIDEFEYKEALTSVIKNKAITRGIETDLNKRLHKLGLVKGRKKPDNS